MDHERQPITINVNYSAEFGTPVSPHFDPEHNIYIPVSPAEFTDERGQPLNSMLLTSLGRLARGNTPKDFVAEHTKIDDALIDMGSARAGEVQIIGPDEGSFYLEIPRHTSQAA